MSASVQDSTADRADTPAPSVAPVASGIDPHAQAALDFDDWAVAAGPGLMRFATAVGGSPVDAPDAVQDAMVAVFPRWHRLSDPGAADAYARRVIVNRRISWWRKIGRRERLVPSEPEGAPGGGDPSSDSAIARSLLRGLPRQQRAAVVLRYLDRFSFAEIADLLGCRESTARSHVHRALRHLRAQLGADDD